MKLMFFAVRERCLKPHNEFNNFFLQTHGQFSETHLKNGAMYLVSVIFVEQRMHAL